MKHFLQFAQCAAGLLLLSATAYAERVVVDGINYETNDDNFTATVVASDGEPYKGALVIPASITYNNRTYDVTNIESTAFSYNGFITSVDIHAPITETGSMFSGCTSLTSVSLPETVTTIGSYAFSGCTSLASFTVDNNISTIRYSAFDGCESLEEFVIKDGDTPISLDDMSTMPVKRLQIGREINFTSYSSPKWNSSTLEYATISGNVKTVPDNMFNMCSSLKSLTIGEGVTTIGEWACSGCTSLTDITLPESVDSIGMNAFSYCSGLEEITVPSKMDYLASSLFEYCSALKDVTLPEGLKCIGENAFGWCEEIDTLRLPSTLETIDRTAFAECRGLEAIIMCNGVKMVGDGAFESCTSLEKVYYKGSLEEWLAIRMDGMTYEEDTCPLSYAKEFYVNYGTGDEQLVTDVTIPEGVTDIGQFAFAGYKGLRSLTVPETVNSVGYMAFSYCINLNNLVLRARNIGDYAFFATNLKTATIGPRMRKVGVMAFRPYYSNNLERTDYEGTLPEWLGTTFADPDGNPFVRHDFYVDGKLISGHLRLPCNFAKAYTFYGCPAITSVDVPYIEPNIEPYSFAEMPNITSLKINGVEQLNAPAALEAENGGIILGDGAFSGCPKLADIDINFDQVEYIGAGVFDRTAWYDSKPDGLIYLGDFAYKYKGDMPEGTSVTVEDGTRGICGGAFEFCQNMTDIRLPQSLTSIGASAFSNCTGLTGIDLPDGVNSIGSYAFSECTGLTDVELPDALTEVSDGVLYNCTSLKSVTIPGNVTKIGSLAVYSNSIEKLTCLAVVPPALHILLPDINPDGSDSFGLSYNTKIYIPEGSLEAYCNAPGWRIWATYFEEFVPSGINTVENANGNTSERHYDMSGKAVPPTAKGLHIVRGSDGKTRKVIVR